MSDLTTSRKPNLLGRVLSAFDGEGERLEQEKARLEAFLNAVPGEYCGWARDGSAVYSHGFCESLELDAIRSIADIQNCFSPQDGAELEGLFNALHEDAAAFRITTRHEKNGRYFRISGVKGRALNASDSFDILWIEDVTDQQNAEESLREKLSAQKEESKSLAHQMDMHPLPTWLRDEEQKIIWCNEAYAVLLGKDKDLILKEQKELVLPPKQPSGASARLPGKELAAKALQSGQEETAECHIIARGNRLLVRITETPAGEDITLGFLQDITAQEDVKTQLETNKSAYRDLLEHMRSAVAIYGSDHKLEFYNGAFAQLWGVEEGWLNTKPKLGDILEKLRETRRLPEQADFRSYKKGWLDMFTGLIEPHEDMMYLPDGSALRLFIIPHRLGGLMMTFEDVTSRLALESSYNTLIAVQKETLDNLDEAVAVFGGDGRLKLSNPAFGRLWKLGPEALEGEPHITTIAERVKSRFEETQQLSAKEVLIGLAIDRVMNEGRLTCIGGVLIDYTTVPLPDGGVLLTFTDVTDTVRVENALREKNAALEAAERLKLDFLANVSYQLRTPLNAIMGFNEILDKEYFGSLNERQKQYTGDMREASQKLLGLINDILDLSSIEAGYLRLEPKDIDLHKMLSAVVELVGEWGRKQSVEISLKCAKSIGKLQGDEARLKQAVVNVIRNAIAFTPEGGKISVQAKAFKDENAFEISVSDTGPGIPEADLERILAPFEVVAAGSKKAGAGLGLALVRHIIQMHGGALSIESKEGEGTKVTLRLPATFELRDDRTAEETAQNSANLYL